MKHLALFTDSVQKKLIALIMVTIIVSVVTVGLVSYYIAKNALNDKGEQILQNSVKYAIDLIESKDDLVIAGAITLEEAQESVRTTLLGPLSDEGTRTLHRNIDLGEHGYFLAYDIEGLEVMHPTLEGQNVWEVKDFGDDETYVVQEQIETALAGGGFTYYAWLLPHSEVVGEKVSYVYYEERWGWIVVSTAYLGDFNDDASPIFMVLIELIVLIIIILYYLIQYYVRGTIGPVVKVSKGMKEVQGGYFTQLDKVESNDEIQELVDGFNTMSSALEVAENNIAANNSRLSYLAYNDELTGLMNRYGMRASINEQINVDCSSGYMVLTDIRGLEDINSTRGREHGDYILSLIGLFFRNYETYAFRVARTSENEFALWIQGGEPSAVHQMVYDIRDAAVRFVESKEDCHLLSMYLSMSVCKAQNKKFDQLYREASIAMRIAKSRNEINIFTYEHSMKDSIEEELLMRKHLKVAIDEGEIIPFFQEKVDYTTGKVVGVEALARWTSKELGPVGPNVFIPLLTKFNMINVFTDYILDVVLGCYDDLTAKYGEEINVSINIPPSYFLEFEFISKVKAVLEKYDTPMYKLTLEVTEDALIKNVKEVNRIVGLLHEMQVRVSIDDFGTGYSSLNYLTLIDFDELKIDKSFIDMIENDTRSIKMIKSLCDIADIYDYDVVAEGVESQEQLELLKDSSLKVVQGYLFSKPLPIK